MPIRTRKQYPNRYTVDNHVYGWAEGGANPFNIHNVDTCSPMSEVFTDDTAGLGVFYTKCDHVKYNKAHYIGELMQTHYSDDLIVSRRVMEHVVRTFHGSGHFSHRLAYNVASSILTDEEAFTRSVVRLEPRMPKYVSVLNFLYELRDFKRMFEFWNKRKRLLYNIANGILNAEFGWQPFITDCVNMLKSLYEFQKKLKKFISDQHTVQVRHDRTIPRTFDPTIDDDIILGDLSVPGSYTCPLYREDGTIIMLPPGTTEGAYFGVTGNILVRLAEPITRVVTLKYTYHIKRARIMDDETSAWLDAFGVSWDPAIIWEAVPFSFIIDWFFNVQSWLQRKYAEPNLPIELRFLDCCITAKVKTHARGIIDVPRHLVDHSKGFTRIHVEDFTTVYIRDARLPSLENLLKFGTPASILNKIVLSLALGHNCSRPRKRRIH